MSSSTCIASPILRHSNSEARSSAWRRNGSAVLGLQGPRPSGSPVFSRPQRVNSTSPQAESGKARLNRSQSESKIAPRSLNLPARRSPSRQARRSRSCVGSEPTSPPHRRSPNGAENELERVLGDALGLNSGEAAAQDRSSCIHSKHRESNEIEAHLEALLENFDDKENEECDTRQVAVDTRIESAKGDRATGDDGKAFRNDSGGAHLRSAPEKNKGRRRSAQIMDSHGDNENKIMRKGTGFVYVVPTDQRARIDDPHGDNENSIVRKGTGFIHLSDSLEKPQGKRVRIDDQHGDNENKIVRVATGYVNLSSLPKMEPAPWFPGVAGGVNRIHRKGTGYINLQQASRRVRIADDHGDNENGIQREGTGFVFLKNLPHEEQDVDFSVYEDALDVLTAAV